MCICLVQFLVQEYYDIILLSSKSIAAFIYFQRALLPVSLIKCINSRHWWCWSTLEWLLLRYGTGLHENKVSGYLASINSSPSKHKTASVRANKKKTSSKNLLARNCFGRYFRESQLYNFVLRKTHLWAFVSSFSEFSNTISLSLNGKQISTFEWKKCFSLLMKTLNVNL